MTVATIVLAAGSSLRMGRNKLLLELEGETVVQRAVRTACAAALGPVLVVTGHAHEGVAGELRGLECQTIVNPDHAEGQHTSVRAGAAALSGECAAAIVMLADMPFVTAEMLAALARCHRESGAALVRSRYGDLGVAPPILYDRSLFGELAQVDRRCGRGLMHRWRNAAAEVVHPAAALYDLDRPEDYARARRLLSARSVPDSSISDHSTPASSARSATSPRA